MCTISARRADDAVTPPPYLGAGDVALRSSRPNAIENFLFAGSEGGANRLAIVASLVETAKLDGVDPFA